MNIKQLIGLLMAATILASAVYAFNWELNPLAWRPECTLTSEPGKGWIESYAADSEQDYCWSDDNTTLFIAQPYLINFLGEPFTTAMTDAWTYSNYTKSTGNLREVLITFEYYAPSNPAGVCTHTSINAVTGLYNSPQVVLITNDDSDLSAEGTFDDAFYQFNNEIVCDEWRLFNHRVKEFTNDYGSSFSGQSKAIGSLGFEAKNIYIREVMIIDLELVEVLI